MKKVYALFLIVSLLFVSVVTFAIVYNSPQAKPEAKPFYVGVTYCGNSTEEAKQLIDKVKDYTNLFVLQSGEIQQYPQQITEICDYAASSDMYFIVYFGFARTIYLNEWLETTYGRWGDKFLGIYYSDELGGKLLDFEAKLGTPETGSFVFSKCKNGAISGFSVDENSTASYWVDGRIELIIFEPSELFSLNQTTVQYYPNGTITATRTIDYGVRRLENSSESEFGTIHFGNTSSIESIPLENYTATYSYEELWALNPFKTYDDVAEGFVYYYCNCVDKNAHGEKNVTAFTSDYALYWWDYQIGYDVILAQLGWNHTLTQDIALVRGAARLHNKDWGAIITWKYNNPPYLDSGEAIYEQMVMAYDAGATYVVIFNYAEDMVGSYGTLQPEHFEALEQFWNTVQNQEITHGGTQAEAGLVLPQNYGWGMRNSDDTIWGLWRPDEKSLQIWQLSRSLLEQYGLGLDIVYTDSAFPVEGVYPQVYYWNQTS